MVDSHLEGGAWMSPGVRAEEQNWTDRYMVLQVFSRMGGVNDALRGFRPSFKSFLVREVFLEGSKDKINETQ